MDYYEGLNLTSFDRYYWYPENFQAYRDKVSQRATTLAYWWRQALRQPPQLDMFGKLMDVGEAYQASYIDCIVEAAKKPDDLIENPRTKELVTLGVVWPLIVGMTQERTNLLNKALTHQPLHRRIGNVVVYLHTKGNESNSRPGPLKHNMYSRERYWHETVQNAKQEEYINGDTSSPAVWACVATERILSDQMGMESGVLLDRVDCRYSD